MVSHTKVGVRKGPCNVFVTVLFNFHLPVAVVAY